MMFTYKELIDVAIGSPESGHVNFYALHVLLSNFAQKLECIDEVVEQDDYLTTSLRRQSSLLTVGKPSKYRLFAGGDPEDDAENAEAEAPGEAEAAPIEAAEDLTPAEELPPPVEPEPVAEPEPEVIPEAAPVETVEPEVQPSPQAEPEPEPEQHIDEPALPMTEQVPEPQPEAEPAAPEKEPELDQKTLPSPALASRVSSRSSTREKVSHTRLDGSITNNLSRLEKRISKMELQKEQASMEMQQFVGNLTGQLKLTMKQLNNVTHFLLDRKPNPDRAKLLRQFARQLRVLMRTVGDDEISISWTSGEAAIEEMEEVEEEMAVEESATATEVDKPEEEASLELEQHLCYSPERMLTEFLELKSQFCALTNKVNELAAALLKDDAHRLMELMQEMQETVRDIRLASATSRETMQNINTKIDLISSQVVQIKKSISHLDELKIDKTEVELLLAEKVDYQQLATKVSLEQLEEYKARLEKQFCEVRYIVSSNEKNVLQIIDNLRMTLGIDALELGLKDFREIIEKRVALIAEALQKYMEMTNDDCAAAAGRVKVMQELACLSCDTPCVMRTMERSKVPTLPSAKGSTGLGPIVTYELGQIRKSGIMGYYRKDEFPHASSAWTKGIPMNKCVPRHAGGNHTTHTADDHMQKVVLSKKNAGWT
ncbi:zinc metalloprotease ZmpB [Drosophila willistoni]|uniref:zinc metalloprotease ZmpB n=1 Tax=Drosophila willistoni TaxID=7260 RepID=UPI001F07642C|nr:zinc metalloprotease ZmpB [Drosophila willistoni]